MEFFEHGGERWGTVCFVHVGSLSSAMAKCAGPRLPLVTKALLCTQSSVYEIQRVTSTAFLAEVRRVKHELLPGTGRLP